MLLLSIHPKYVDAIFAGKKRFELRRRQPRIDNGNALVYATTPRMELVGTFRIASVVRAPLDLLWQLVREAASISRPEFNGYFQGLDFGVAIQIADVVEFLEPVPLDRLRAEWKDFQPPQGFRYIESSDVARLGIRRRRVA